MDYSSEANTKRRKKYKSRKKKIKNKANAIIFKVVIAVVLVAGFAVAGAAVGAYMGIIENAPVLNPVKMRPDVYTSTILDDMGNEIDTYSGVENRVYVSMKDIPVNLANAFVSIEDERFYSHDGIDFKGMLRAVKETLTSDQTQGASTITQQVIKNILKVSRNTLTTKLQEQYLAVQYEKTLVEEYGSKRAAKEHILEVYLNAAFLGHSVYGVKTASEFYFGKDVSELTLSECAVIAAITQHPTKYTPKFYPEQNRKRQMTCLDNMLKQGMITKAEYDEAVADDVYSRIGQVTKKADEEKTYHSYFSEMVFDSVSKALQDKYGMPAREADYYVYTAGLTIYSTQDAKIQEIVDNAYSNDAFFPAKDFEIDIKYTLAGKNTVTGAVTDYPEQRKTVKKESDVEPFIQSVREKYLKANDEVFMENIITIPQPQSGMVIMDHHTGEVKAISGGRGEKTGDRWFNRATSATRQPGSVFKVVASYLPAIDMGLVTPGTVIDDVPYTIGEYSPNNWYSGYKGLSTVRMGIVGSMNILAVKNIVNTGIEPSYNYLKNLGFTTLVDGETRNSKYFTDKNATTALGGITDGVTQLELTAAYGAIANGGEYNKPIFFTKVLDHDGVTLLENPIEPQTVIKPTTAYLLTDMMKEVLTGTFGINGTGGKARFSNVKMPIAGKTGTTTDTKELVFVGYTPYYTAGVYLGFDQPKTISDEGHHLRIWSAIMEEVHKDLPYKDFERPAGIVDVQICRVSGKLPAPGLCDHDPRGSMIYTEKFASGTEPEDECGVHTTITIDSVMQKLASPYCPDDLLETIVIIRRPEPYDGGAYIDDQQYEYKRYTTEGECDFHGPNGEQHQPAETPGSWMDFYAPINTQEPADNTNPTGGGSFTMTPMPPIMPEATETAPPVNPFAPGIVPTQQPERTPEVFFTPPPVYMP